MSGHHPAHTRMPLGNPPPVEHGIGGWNHMSHEAPGVGLIPGALNQPQQNLYGMVPQTAHLGSALPLRAPHPAWLNKVPGGSHNGDGSGLPPNPAAGAPANQLFMQILANRDRGVGASVPAGYCAPNPYQGGMIDLSRPTAAASLERMEPLPLVTGSSSSGEKESHSLVRNGTATSESAGPLNGQLESETKTAPAVVSVIATNPSHEQKVVKVDHPVRPSDGSVDLNSKTDSDKSKSPVSHLKAAPAPVQAIIGHSKKVKSVEAIVENLFELGSKKQEADSTNTTGPVADSPSLTSSKSNATLTVPKPDSNVSDSQGESEDGDCKMRRKRKIDTPRKSMSPPPVKRALMLDHPVVPVHPEISPKPCPSILPVPVDSVSTTPSTTITPPSPAATPSAPTPSSAPIPSSAPEPESFLAALEDDSSSETKDPIKKELPMPEPVAIPSATSPSASLPVKSDAPISSESLLSALTEDPEDAPKEESKSAVEDSKSAVEDSKSTVEDPKSAVVDVESKMEELFAGIIGSGDEGAAGPSAAFGGDLTNPLTPLNESLDLDTSTNIAAVLEAKPPSAKKGRPKGSRNGIRQSSDSIFGTSSTESTPQKGKKMKKKTAKDAAFGESSKKNKKSAATGKKAKFQKEPSQQTCDSGSTVSSVRIRGPVVHCVGPRDSPNQVSIVNAPSREDEDQEKSKKPPAGRRKILQNEGKINSSGTCSFTLVTRGELEHPQTPNIWICAFCKTGPHVNGAGDLFGPYLIRNNDDLDQDGNDKKKGKHSASNLHLGSQLGMLPVTPSPGEKIHYVVWLHEDCAVWAAGVYFVGARLAGLDEAVWAASTTKCDRCRHFGANLGCLHHGCPQRAHYKCAQDGGWYLNEELFKSTCSSHPMKEDTN